MGGAWDATNVADAAVAVITPIGVDHAQLPRRPAGRDRRREGRDHQARRDRRSRAARSDDVAEVLAGARPRSARRSLREGLEFGVAHRVPAVGGQMLSLQGLRGEYDEVFLPLYGAHQAQNAALRAGRGRGVPRRRASRSTTELVREAFARGHLARAGWRWSGAARRSCSTPRTTRTAPRRMVDALEDSFAFNPLIGVVGVMADKDYEGVLATLEPVLAAHGLHPELHRPGDAGRGAGRGRARDLRQGPGARRAGGWTTRSTRRRPWPRTAASSARRSARRRTRHRLRGHRRRGPALLRHREGPP